MVEDQEIVIVGADGTEHIFPSGFDPKRAAAIVRNQESVPTSQPTSFQEGFDRNLADTAKRTGAGILRGMFVDAPSGLLSMAQAASGDIPQNAAIGESLYQTARHPLDAISSLSDPATGGRAIGQLVAGGLSGRIIPAAEVSRGPVGSAVTASGDALTALGKSRLSNYVGAFGAYHQLMSGHPATATALGIAPAAVRALGPRLSMMGRVISGEAGPALAESAAPSMAGLSAADVASLQRSRYPPDLIAKIGARAAATSPGPPQPMPLAPPRVPEIIPTPPAPPVRPAPPPLSVNASSLPDSWKPFANTFKGSNPQLNDTLRPFLTADKIVAIRNLVEQQGMSWPDAFAQVTRGLTPADETFIRR